MLGVAESFRKHVSKKSVLAGVVMRADSIIDGISFAFPTVGGVDATEKLQELFESLNREDVNVLCVSGSVISWYNVIDFHSLHEQLGLPTISITYDKSEGLVEHFKRNFPEDWEGRVEVYRRNGERFRVELRTGFEVYVRGYGIDLEETTDILNAFTIQGRYPEPIRVARLVSHSIVKSYAHMLMMAPNREET